MEDPWISKLETSCYGSCRAAADGGREDKLVKAWLDEVAYDVEDLLDEIATDALKSVNKERSKLYSFVEASDSVKSRIDSKGKEVATC